MKGPNVFKGYLKDPKRTAETLDANGWLHTGDIGKWLPVSAQSLHCSLIQFAFPSHSCNSCNVLLQNGTLKIIDRKKHIFKLAQGEYISPEKIENIYIRSEPVAQLYVHGDSLQVINQKTFTPTLLVIVLTELIPISLHFPVFFGRNYSS